MPARLTISRDSYSKNRIFGDGTLVDRLAKGRERGDRRVSQAQLEMEVRTGGEAGRAHVADPRPGHDLLPEPDPDPGHVRVHRPNSQRVRDHDQVPVSARVPA